MIENSAPRARRLGLVGLGYAGLPLAAAAHMSGVTIAGYDTDHERVELLKSATSFTEDVPGSVLRSMLEAGCQFSTDPAVLSDVDAILMSVPTPLDADGRPNLSYIEEAGGAIGPALRRDVIVIFESTSFPGTTEEVLRPILERRSGLTAGKDFALAFSPERVDPSNTIFGVSNTPRLVAGLTERCLSRAAVVLRWFCSVVVEMTGIREAEYAKLIENTHRQVNIALVNELLVVGRSLDIDVREALRGAATKPYGYTPFSPGPGVGGHCIPVDPLYLVDAARRADVTPTLIEAAQRINDGMPNYTAERILSALSERQPQVTVPRVLLVGVGYKPRIADTRNSPAAALYSQLLARGCELAYHDDLVMNWKPDGATAALSSVALAPSLAADYDVVVLLQDACAHVAFAMTLELSNTLVFDTRGAMAHAHWVVQL